jgi:hypothetical protein
MRFPLGYNEKTEAQMKIGDTALVLHEHSDNPFFSGKVMAFSSCGKWIQVGEGLYSWHQASRVVHLNGDKDLDFSKIPKTKDKEAAGCMAMAVVLIILAAFTALCTGAGLSRLLALEVRVTTIELSKAESGE